MTDIDNFTTTHYHIKEEYAVDKAKPIEQVHESSYMYYIKKNIRFIKKKNEQLIYWSKCVLPDPLTKLLPLA